MRSRPLPTAGGQCAAGGPQVGVTGKFLAGQSAAFAAPPNTKLDTSRRARPIPPLFLKVALRQKYASPAGLRVQTVCAQIQGRHKCRCRSHTSVTRAVCPGADV